MARHAVRTRAGATAEAARRWGQPHATTILSKHVFMYRHALFRTERLGIPFKMPPAHPLDPNKALRLAALADGDITVVREIFRYIWRQGRDCASAEGFRALCEHIGMPDAETRIDDEDVKAKLRANNDRAVELGAFGVPTFVINDQIFWGEGHAADGALCRALAELAAEPPQKSGNRPGNAMHSARAMALKSDKRST